MIITLSGLGVILAEILKKWHLFPQDFSNFWVIIPAWALFTATWLLRSPAIKRWSHKHPAAGRLFRQSVNTSLVIIAVLIFFSIPFIWYGTIEQLAAGAG